MAAKFEVRLQADVPFSKPSANSGKVEAAADPRGTSDKAIGTNNEIARSFAATVRER